MVRTYKVSALTQSDSMFSHTHRAKEVKSRQGARGKLAPALQSVPSSAPADPAPPNKIQHSNIQPKCSQCQSYEMLHSPYVDPVGSIVGLRVVYMDGKISYVPVEPQINYLINKQFGPYFSPQCSHTHMPAPLQLPPQWDYNPVMPRVPYQVPMQIGSFGPSQSQSPPADPGPQPVHFYTQQPPVPPATSNWNQPQYERNSQNIQRPNEDYVRSQQNYVEKYPGQGQSLQRTNNFVAKENPKEKSMEGGFFMSNPQPKSGIRRSRDWMNDDKDYNPWGKGGGGSPLKDEFGNLVADRRQLGRSWKTQLSTNQPHHLHVDRFGQSYRSSLLPDFSNNYWHYSSPQTPSYSVGGANMSYPSSGSMPNLNTRALSDSDRHKMELQQQIDDNKRRKEQEKQREREEEEREMRKHEEYMSRMRRTEEEEKRREREKAIMAEKRREQVHEEQQRMAKQMKRVRSPPPTAARNYQPAPTPNSDDRGDQYWWEKNPNYNKPIEEDRKSAVIPTLRGKPPRPSSRGPSANGRSVSRNSRSTYDPSTSVNDHVVQDEREERENSAKSQRTASRRSRHTSSDELSESFRRMSATETALSAERQRVHTALSNKNYGEHVFSDNNGRPTAFVIR